MNKLMLAAALVICCLLPTACQKAPTPEGKKEVKVQQSTETKPLEIKPEGQPMQKIQQPPPPNTKEEKKEKAVETIGSSLTEEEQKFVEKYGYDASVSPNVFKSDAEAMKYLRILLKGDYKTVRWFNQYYQQNKLSTSEIVTLYDNCMETVLSAINPTKKEGYDLVVEVLKTKREYPAALAKAARVIKFAENRNVVPLLQEVVKHPSAKVRLEAAGSLLSLGDADTALPVLDELTKEGLTAALGDIFHNMQGKEWEQKGIGLIRKALTYKNNESRALAVLFLIGLTKKGYIKEDLEKLENILFEISEEILAKKKWVISSYGYSDHRALETVILAFEELKSKKAISILKRMAAHPEASYIDRHASEAIKHISGKERGVK